VSDPHDAGPEPELTPEQEATVSRLLAEARHTGPVPDDVALRLDRALADLSHADLEPVGAAPAGPSHDQSQVVDLAAHRRRRRNAGRLLAAAAAVIVAGVGVGQVIGNDSGGDQSASDSGAAAGQSLDRSSESAASSAGPSAGAPSQQELEGAAPGAPQALSQVVPLELSGDAAQLEQQVTDQLGAVSSALGDSLTTPAPPADQLERLDSAGPSFDCPDPVSGSYGAGELLPAFYEGQPVVLALRPSASQLLDSAEGDTQADLLECGTGAAVTTFTVTLP
jgi:hypothetical protein